MNITHAQKDNVVLEYPPLQDYSNNALLGLVITEDDSLWEDLLLLAATVKLTLKRGNSFSIWQYWNEEFPLFLEVDFAMQLPNYWKLRPNLWIVFTELQAKEYHTQINYLPVAQYIILPTEITDFITSFSSGNESAAISTSTIKIGSFESILRQLSMKPVPKSISSPKLTLESIAIMGAQGGAGASLLAFVITYLIGKSHAALYVDTAGMGNAISLGVEDIPTISPVYRDSTSVSHQILSSYPRSALGFYLADGTQAFHAEIELQNFIQKLSDNAICSVFDVGKFSAAALQTWCLEKCGKIILVSRGYPQSATMIYKAKKIYPQLNFIVVLLGKFQCGLKQALFEQLAQTTINHFLPWDTRLHFSYQAGNLKIPTGFLKQVSMILEQENG